MPADADALAAREGRHSGAHLVDDSGDLMARNAGEADARVLAILGQRVAVTDSAGLDADADVPGRRVGNLALDHLELAAGLGYLYDLHLRHRPSPVFLPGWSRDTTRLVEP